MKSAIQYISDKNGNMQAIQLPLVEWKKLMVKLKKYETLLMLKSDLAESFSEVEKMKKGQIKKQTLADFLNEL